MSQPFYRRVVPETYVQLLYEYVETQGHDPEALLGQPWPVSLPESAGGVDVERWEQLLQTAAAGLNDPLLPLHVGQTVTGRHLGVVGAVLLASGTVAEALQKLDRYLRLVFDVVAMDIQHGKDWIDLAWDDREFSAGDLVIETGFAVLVQFYRSIVRGAVNPLLVTFKHASPADIGPYEEFFGCPVRFGQPGAVVRFGNEILALPLKSPDPKLVSLLEQHADRLLAQLPSQAEIVERTRRAIASTIDEGEPDINVISAQLGCSTRTLQRRLQEAGANFRNEVHLVRYELAKSYLKDPRLRLVDVALLLGYSEHSAFSRAYKEWSGRTPQESRVD